MIALDVDLSTLVGESESPCCEHRNHDKHPVHVDGNEHYIRYSFACGHRQAVVVVVCEAWLMHVFRVDLIVCGRCDQSFSAVESIRDLGPVADFHGPNRGGE